jgi:hypothetical protein
LDKVGGIGLCIARCWNEGGWISSFVLAFASIFSYDGQVVATNRHCWKCGAEYSLTGSPGRTETCDRCGSDWKVCLNCVSYDVRAAYQCRDRRADPVAEKNQANYCEYFEFVRREFKPASGSDDLSRESKARDQLKKLLGES